MILNGAAPEEVAAYLDKVVSDDMELGGNEPSSHASSRTAEALSAYLLGNEPNP